MDISAPSGKNIDNDERLARLALYLALNYNNASFYRILQALGSAAEAFEGHDLRHLGFNSAPLLRLGSFDEAIEQMNYAEKNGLDIIILGDDYYPVRLDELDNPAPVLWVKGSLEKNDKFAVALVGSRKPSEAALNSARRLGSEGAAKGLTIVSGLAKGIDGAAHLGALEAGGRTIAVLGCGLDYIYPKENAGLFDRIPHAGALISEFPPQTSPLPAFFPRRNRVIAGLSLAVVVVEAGERSGALITARLGLELNREVMALPGQAGSQKSRGGNRLIKNGAALVENMDEVLYEIKPRLLEGLKDFKVGMEFNQDDEHSDMANDCRKAGQAIKPPDCLCEAEMKIWLELQKSNSLDVDSLVRITCIGAGDMAVHLLNMELGGFIIKQASGCYCLVI